MTNYTLWGNLPPASRVKLHLTNAEGWSRFAKSFRNRQNTFIRRSMLEVRCSMLISFFFEPKLAALPRLGKSFQASGGACMKLQKIRCRFQKYLTAELAEYAEII